jgi:two-component system, LytTR family, response regulator
MNPIRVLVVDDEKPARERLRRLLAQDARVQLIGCCSGGLEAIEAIRTAHRSAHPIDLLFLDVQMPKLDGFGVVSSLMKDEDVEQIPTLVFVTAHDEYALRAFEAHPVDYLLKPFDDERFEAALDSAIRQVRAGHAHALVTRLQALLGGVHEPQTLTAANTGQPSPLDRIVVKGSNRVRLLPVDQITWIEADGMYVKLHTRDGAVHLHRGLLGSLETLLDVRRFVRIHRSAIVNIDLVSELRQDEYGNYIALLRDRTEVRVGRRFRARLQARLGQPL